METRPLARIVFAERLDGGVVITFEDGRVAIYSASLLDQMFSQANELIEEPDDPSS